MIAPLFSAAIGTLVHAAVLWLLYVIAGFVGKLKSDGAFYSFYIQKTALGVFTMPQVLT